MPKRIIRTNNAPQTIVKSSQAIVANGIVFLSGVSSRDPVTGKVVGATIEEQLERSFLNVRALLEAAGSSMRNACSCVCYLQTRDHFPALNAAFERHFPVDPPTRAVLFVPEFGLPGMMFEVIVTGCVD